MPIFEKKYFDTILHAAKYVVLALGANTFTNVMYLSQNRECLINLQK